MIPENEVDFLKSFLQNQNFSSFFFVKEVLSIMEMQKQKLQYGNIVEKNPHWNKNR